MSTPTTLPEAISGRSALDVARACAREAGELIRRRFREPQDVTAKGRGNLVTETDLEVEGLVKRTLAREFPDHRLLSEETAAETDSAGWVWIADPLDGTRNFVSGTPFFCVNLALCDNAEPVVAVTHDPIHEETFWAERGRGAWLNDQPIRASDKRTVLDSVLGVGLGYDDQRARAGLHLIYRLYPGVQTVRNLGSAALDLAYAAAARHDLFVHFDLSPWDVAAGLLLVPEAGGTITDRTGAPATLRSRSVIAGGAHAHADFLRWQEEHHDQLSVEL